MTSQFQFKTAALPDKLGLLPYYLRMYLLSEAERGNMFENSQLWISGWDKREKMAGYFWLEQLWREPWRTPFWMVVKLPSTYSSKRSGPPESPRHVPSEALRLPGSKKGNSTFSMTITLASGIDVGQGINAGPGKFGKENKHRALNTRLCK